MIWGSCDQCGAPHAFCPDCGAITGFLESDYGEGIECTGGCDRVYVVTEEVSYEHKGYVREVQSLSYLERAIIEGAHKDGSISHAKAEELVRGTKWQFMDIDGWGPLNFMIEEGWLESDEDENGEDVLRLTDRAREFAENYLRDVRLPASHAAASRPRSSATPRSANSSMRATVDRRPASVRRIGHEAGINPHRTRPPALPAAGAVNHEPDARGHSWLSGRTGDVEETADPTHVREDE